MVTPGLSDLYPLKKEAPMHVLDLACHSVLQDLKNLFDRSVSKEWIQIFIASLSFRVFVIF